VPLEPLWLLQHFFARFFIVNLANVYEPLVSRLDEINACAIPLLIIINKMLNDSTQGILAKGEGSVQLISLY
jgi:hypothetical protein